MKRPIHLYIFVILSSIASILRLFSAFVSTLMRSDFVRLCRELLGLM